MRFRTAAIVILVLSAVSASEASLRAGAPPPPAASNPIRAENALPGTIAWDQPQAPPGAIDAYTDEVSVRPGDVIHLHVATDPAAAYRIEVYRLGWYGGTGGRLLECLPSCSGSDAGMPQINPGPDSGSGLLRLDWPVTDRIRVGRDWVSGYYYLNVVLADGATPGTSRHVPVIVRESTRHTSAILVQASVNTWQAYNAWGGLSLYTKPGTPQGSHVSFDRPYDTSHQGPGLWELPALHFLERRGYDVSYATNVDSDRDPGSLLRHALVMSLGHDEYWTHTMRDAFEQARDAGVNLAFMGANDGYWQIRYEQDRRTLVAYRHPDIDPEPNTALKTTTFRELNPPRPECELLGVAYGQIGDSQDFTLNAAALTDPWFRGTGFLPGATLHGLVGYEWNGVQPGCRVPTATVFFHDEHLNGAAPVEGARWDADVTRYTAASGARVFAGGSLQFAWGLDPLQERYDQRLERFMRNALDDLTRPAPPASTATEATQDGIRVAARKSSDAHVTGIIVYRHPGADPFAPGAKGVLAIRAPSCTAFLDQPGRGVFRYALAYMSPWRPSAARLGLAVSYRPNAAATNKRPRCLRRIR